MLRLLTITLILLAFPSAARAAEHSLDVETAAFVGSGKQAQVGLSAAIGYRPKPSYSLGVIASIAKPMSVDCLNHSEPAGSVGDPFLGTCDAPTWTRAAFEARWHALTTSLADAWLGAEVGVAHEAAPLESRFAPVAGAGAGISLYVVPAFSIGAEVRGNLGAWDTHTSESYGLRGVTPALFGGVVFGLHLPIWL